ncbi:MAG: CHC2 zinc finger domain-containing protein, partial [Bacteroidales bacterium]|nr:CHC2 zinc finger domain-containing protein [Bacteroidales bacterium]
MIKSEDISRILEAARIEDVVGVFVPLKKRGANFIGLCPFHDEKTPSFNVNPARGIFKCFGCGEGGDSVAFLMKHQHYTYPEALRWLAERYHIQIEEKEETPEEKKAQSEKDRLFHVNEFAQRYFQDLLFSDPQGQSIGLSYFEERCLTKETIRRWGLGYCKDSWDDFCSAARKEGYTDEELVKAGVAIRNENSGTIYDRFRARITFPIFNIGGRVLG